MAKALSVKSFQENLINGAYSQADLTSIYKNLVKNINSNNNKEKFEILVEYMQDTHKLAQNKRCEEFFQEILSEPVNSPEIIPKITDDDIVNKYCQLRQSATGRDIEFSLSLKDVKSLLSKKKCHYTNITFEGKDSLRRTIDRIDNNKGYISGNVVACTYAANQFKEQVFESKITANFKGNLKIIKKIVATLESIK